MAAPICAVIAAALAYWVHELECWHHESVARTARLLHRILIRQTPKKPSSQSPPCYLKPSCVAATDGNPQRKRSCATLKPRCCG
ncbi:hypothetical protein V8C42DRAFT_309283 [Trichoderma barbatum]